MDHFNGQLQPYKLANTDINKQIWNLNREEKKHIQREKQKMLIYEETWNIWLDADNGFFMMFWC